MIEQIQNLFSNNPEIAEAVISVLVLILALLIIWLLRRAIAWAILRPIRSLVGRTGTDVDDRLMDSIIKPLRFAILGVGLILAVLIVGIEGAIRDFALVVARSLIIIAVVYALYEIIEILLANPNRVLRITGLSIPERLLPFFRKVVEIVVIALGIVIVLQEWSVDVTGLVASIGIIGLAFSLAAQDTASNIFGFTAVVSDNPFDVGDFITTSDVSGIVESVGMRSTRVRQLDQAIVTVPNSMLSNKAVLNWSRLAKRRLDMTIGVTYDSTSQQMRALLHNIRQLLDERESVDSESIVVYLINFGSSSLDILVRCYILISDWGEFTAEKELILLDIMELIEEMDMSIAFPSRSLYIETMPGMELPEPQLSKRTQALMHLADTVKNEVPVKQPESGQKDGSDEIDDSEHEANPQDK